MTALAEELGAATRLLAGVRRDGRPVSLEEHLRRYGALALGDSLIEEVERAGLVGRGGAAFPTAVKLRAVRDAGRGAVVVANGAEGEPAAAKDAVLTGYVPHLVLDGAVAAAQAVRAAEAIVAVPATLVPVVEHAIRERHARRLDGRLALRAVAVPETFVAGEETALVQFLNGGPAKPTFTPPRPFERGVGGHPTLVQNVETLAHLALIARYGAAWFRAVGTAEQPGTTLMTVGGAVRTGGVYEIPIGYPLSSLLADAGGPTREPQAFLVGGYFGTWLPASAASVPLADADLVPYGAGLGARALVVLPAGRCGVAETAKIARYLADHSAGQCGPCVHGLAAVADDMDQLARRRPHVDTERLARRLEVIATRGACHHPDGAVRFVASGLRVFEADVRRHLENRRCAAGAA